MGALVDPVRVYVPAKLVAASVVARVVVIRVVGMKAVRCIVGDVVGVGSMFNGWI
jgi:hypothetical protein